ncbi:unnamed protein product [Effrenium voratum]|uniref:Uncharacterized protein n=1 Tax=Effrenium voratum TaxID=2562239 RepID=A0AA36NI80_9DINO|nr:unnamed protein product [Effrenium voratum]
MDAELGTSLLCADSMRIFGAVLVAYHNHIVPYFQSSQVGEFTKGFDFSHDGVRFQVVGVLPEDGYGVAGQSTEIFYEGPEIERKVLERLHALPFEDGLPEKYRPSKLSLDEAALLRDFLRPYFGQRSATVKANDVLEIQGVKFKVISTRPTEGGGVGKDTELVCQGVALRESFQPAARSKAKAAAKPGAKPAAKAAAAAASSDGQCRVMSLNKFMAFENRDPFQAKQEQMENPNCTAWHRWCADQYLRLAMEEGEEMDDSVDGSGRPLEHMASRKGVVTLQTCAHPNRGHAFPCGDAGGLLLRAGAKLGFDPAQVLAADSDASAASSAAAAVVRKLPARCCCGAHPAKGASGAEDLQRLLDVGAKRVTLHLAEESRPLEVFEGSKDGETCPAPAARPAEPAPGASELPAPATSEREQRLRKQPPRQLRQRAQALWAVLEKKSFKGVLQAREDL